MSPSLAQRQAALIQANEVREQLKTFKFDVRTGRLTLEEVLHDPPGCVTQLLLCELLLLMPGIHRKKVEMLGKRAHMSGINLFVRVENMSGFTVDWVLDNQPLLAAHTGQRARARNVRGRAGVLP